MKSALQKHAQAAGRHDAWDDLSNIMRGYKTSKQASTKLSPAYVLYGRHPTIPPAVRERWNAPLQFLDPPCADDVALLLMRANEDTRVGGTVADNLRLAQHRDTLRYAVTRSGAWHPKARRFVVSCSAGYHLACLDPPLTAVSSGSWQCHSCVFNNIPLPTVFPAPIPVAPNGPTMRRHGVNLKYEGRFVQVEFPHVAGFLYGVVQ